MEVYSVKVDMERAIVNAYAEALSHVFTVYETQECWAFGDAEGCIVTEDEVICARCRASSVAYSDIKKMDAVATASAF